MKESSGSEDLYKGMKPIERTQEPVLDKNDKKEKPRNYMLSDHEVSLIREAIEFVRENLLRQDEDDPGSIDTKKLKEWLEEVKKIKEKLI